MPWIAALPAGTTPELQLRVVTTVVTSLPVVMTAATPPRGVTAATTPGVRVRAGGTPAVASVARVIETPAVARDPVARPRIGAAVRIVVGTHRARATVPVATSRAPGLGAVASLRTSVAAPSAAAGIGDVGPTATIDLVHVAISGGATARAAAASGLASAAMPGEAAVMPRAAADSDRSVPVASGPGSPVATGATGGSGPARARSLVRAVPTGPIALVVMRDLAADVGVARKDSPRVAGIAMTGAVRMCEVRGGTRVNAVGLPAVARPVRAAGTAGVRAAGRGAIRCGPWRGMCCGRFGSGTRMRILCCRGFCGSGGSVGGMLRWLPSSRMGPAGRKGCWMR